MGKKLEKVRAKLAAVQRELDTQSARAQAAEARAAEAEELAGRRPPGMTGELAAVFREAEEAVVRIVEESRSSVVAETATDVTERARIDEEIAQLAAWRYRVEPHVEPLHDAIVEAQHELELVATLVKEALEPINLALTGLGARLDAFMEVAGDSPDDVVVDISSGEHRTPTVPNGG
jgi:hypothetical protein